MALRALLLLALLSLLDANGTPRAAHTSLRGGGNGRKEVNGSEVHTMTTNNPATSPGNFGPPSLSAVCQIVIASKFAA